MRGRTIVRHFIPHEHEDQEAQGESYHRAHAILPVALFIYLQIFVLFVAGFYLIKVKVPQILGTASFGAEQVVALTNSKRAENGLGSLSINNALAQAANAKGNDMFASDYWAHNSPSGKTPWSFISAAGYRYIYAGENLARDFNDAPSVVAAWMNSPTHRANILDKNFKEIGVAVTTGTLTGREGVLVVQMFGSSVSQIPSAPLAEASPKAEPAPVPNIAANPTSIAELTPSSLPSPSLAPQIQESPRVVAQAPDVESLPTRQATVLASRQFSIAKLLSLSMVSFIFVLFALEIIYTSRHEHLRLRSGVVAHLGLLGFVLVTLWYAVQGAVI